MTNQMTRRRFLRNAGLGAGSVVMLAACQPMAADPAGDEGGAEPAAESVSIISMTWGRAEMMEDVAAAFMESNEGAIAVENQTLGWGDYWTKLNTLYASGSPPDSAWTHTAWVRPHAVLGAIEDLNPRIDASPDFPMTGTNPFGAFSLSKVGSTGPVGTSACRGFGSTGLSMRRPA